MHGELLDEIRQLLEDYHEIEPERVHLTTDVFSDLRLDSLDVVEAVAVFQDRYDIEIPTKELAGLRTIGAFLDRVSNKVDRGRGAV